MGKKRTPKQKPKETRQFRISPALSYGLLVAILLFIGLVRVRLLGFPLERDEGEYAYAGQLILHGIAPYQLCYTMKLPGTAASYALIEAIFGHSAVSVHLGLLLVNSATIVLVFLLGKRLFGVLGAIVASATYGLLSLEPSVLGFAGHATQFVVLPAVGGILVLLQAEESQKLAAFFWSGLLLGFALLMKQPGIFFVFFGMFWVVWSARKRRVSWRNWALQLATLFSGAMLPWLGTCLLLFVMGVFPNFWFWTFTYARQYGTERSLAEGIHDLWITGVPVLSQAPLIWCIAAVGVLAMLYDPKTRPYFAFTVSVLALSFGAMCPGLYFRNHYFVLVLPAVSLLCAAAVVAASNVLHEFHYTQTWQTLPMVVFAGCFVFSVLQQRDFFFDEDPLTLCRTVYSTNPFAEAIQISDYIKEHSVSSDRIAVIGSEPEIYFYSDRLSATGYIYMYPLMETQPFASTMQKEMISEVEKARPRFVVFVDTQLSWLRRQESDMTILEWSDRYLRNEYRLVGLADMLQEGTQYRWDGAATYAPRSPYRVYLFDRK